MFRWLFEACMFMNEDYLALLCVIWKERNKRTLYAYVMWKKLNFSLIRGWTIMWFNHLFFFSLIFRYVYLFKKKETNVLFSTHRRICIREYAYVMWKKIDMYIYFVIALWVFFEIACAEKTWPVWLAQFLIDNFYF